MKKTMRDQLKALYGGGWGYRVDKMTDRQILVMLIRFKLTGKI